MTLLQIETPRTESRGPAPFALFALGFRPFFLGAGLAAVALLGVWLAQWFGWVEFSAYYGASGWHAHEMLFGFTAAVIAGFLLTAVRNWTGIDTPTGYALAALAALWLAGRLLPLLPGTPGALIALVDLAFLPAVAAALARPLFAGPNKTNRVMLLFLGVMTVANLLVHLEGLGVAATAGNGVQLMLYAILLLLLMISGRVLPFFTEAAVPGLQTRRVAAIEVATFVFGAVLLASEVAVRGHWIGALAAGALALVQIARVGGWFGRGVLQVPILWVLYTGYLWLIVGLGLKALAGFGWVNPNLALHALTVGGIGLFTLGMMARVALGHTGRPMRSARAIDLAFVLMNLAVLLRVFGPLVRVEAYDTWLLASGLVWMLAFGLFVLVYAPILTRARVDGRPG